VLAHYAGAHLVEYRDQPEALEWYASGAVPRDTPGLADEADGLTALDDAAGDALYSDLETADVDSYAARDPGEDLEALDDAADGLGAAAGFGVPLAVSSPITPLATSDSHSAQTPEPQAPQSTASLPLADWYPDPNGVKRSRYWDGIAWTDHVAD
jgi:hypothetical protein